jgi:electron transport complex protein RnfG
MAKLESNLKNMVLSLVFISMGMSAALGYVYLLTKEPIEKANKEKEVSAVKMVLPEFDNDPVKEMKTIDGLSFYPASKGGQFIGCAVNTFTDKAFSGKFTMMVGFLPDGTINKSVVLDQKETPGLGTKMKEPKFYSQFENKKFEGELKVKKDGGDIDAISAATITSRAYCDGINRAYKLFMKEFANETNSNKIDTTTTDKALETLKKEE